MKLIAKFLIVVGFCVGTLGAAGFQTPAGDGTRTTEQYAWLLFGGGFVVMTMGGVLGRSSREVPAHAKEAEAGDRAVHLVRIATARDAVARLDAERVGLDGHALRARLEEVLEGELFDVTSRFEDTLASLGFTDYAAVWEGVANAERLLNRAWSMATDGHVDEAREELPLARANLERAVAALGRYGVRTDSTR